MTFFDKITFNRITISKAFCLVSFLSFLVSVGVQVYFSNNSAIKSNEMISLSERKAKLEQDITDLSTEITAISSLSNIERRAREKGFVAMEGSLLVVKPTTVAMAR